MTIKEKSFIVLSNQLKRKTGSIKRIIDRL